MEHFKIKIKELIILILLSAPIGVLLYLNNYNKIAYEIRAKRGFVVTENLCENFSFEKIYLQKEVDIDFLNQKYKSISPSSDSIFNSRMKVSIRNEGTYEVSFKGKTGEEGRMVERSVQVLKDIADSELSNFNNLYKSLKLHCKSGNFTVFKMVPIEKNNIENSKRMTYTNSHLAFLLMVPSIVFYLLFIAFKYIKNIKNKII